MRAALDLARRFASGRDPILILGERGTGKTTLARRIHELSSRGTLVSYQLSATNDDLHLNELFGHTKDAYTGAGADRPGVVEQAAGGTLLLDEFGLASPKVQSSLLALFDPGGIHRVGGGRPRPVTARIIAATNVDLAVLQRRDCSAGTCSIGSGALRSNSRRCGTVGRTFQRS